MSQVAQELGVSLLTVHRYIRRGRLDAVKAPGRNGAVRVTRDALAAFRARERELRTATVDTHAACRMLGLGPRRVQRLAAIGELDTVNAYGHALRITRASITAYRRRKGYDGRAA